MRKLLNACLAASLLLGSFAGAQAQTEGYEATFFEIGLGVRTLNEVPNDVFIKFFDTADPDSAWTNIDFGGGTPLVASIGGVFLPDENGLAGKFGFNGSLGSVSGIGLEVGVGYKLGGARFSFAPMFSIEPSVFWAGSKSIALGEGAYSASFLNLEGDAIYVGEDHEQLHGQSGSDLTYRAKFVAFDLRLGSYISYKVTPTWTLFGRVGYNLNVGQSKTKFDVNGRGYDNLSEYIDAAVAEADGEPGEPPHLLQQQLDTENAIRQNGELMDKIPFDLSGITFQVGIGLHGKE